MTLELILQLKSSASSSVEFNAGIPRNSQRLLIGRERVVCDGVIVEMVNFWSGHIDIFVLIGGALYYQVD